MMFFACPLSSGLILNSFSRISSSIFLYSEANYSSIIILLSSFCHVQFIFLEFHLGSSLSSFGGLLRVPLGSSLSSILAGGDGALGYTELVICRVGWGWSFPSRGGFFFFSWGGEEG